MAKESPSMAKQGRAITIREIALFVLAVFLAFAVFTRYFPRAFASLLDPGNWGAYALPIFFFIAAIAALSAVAWKWGEQNSKSAPTATNAPTPTSPNLQPSAKSPLPAPHYPQLTANSLPIQSPMEKPSPHPPAQTPAAQPPAKTGGKLRTFTREQAEVVSLLKKADGVLSQKELRKSMPWSEAKVSLLLTELEQSGDIKRVKRGRANLIKLLHG